MNMLDVILNNIEEGLVILNPDGQILLFNEQASSIHSLLGWRPLQIDANIFNIIPQYAHPRVSKAILEVKLKKKPIKFFTDRKDIDDNMLYVETHYIPVVQNDTITHINVLIRDITINKIFENKITSIATNLANLIHRASAVIIGVDNRGYITDWNIHCREIIGYSANEVFTKKFVDVMLAQEDVSTFENALKIALQNKGVRNIELPVYGKNAKRLNLLLSASPRATVNDRVTGVIFVGQDITELTAYRESLEKIVEQRTYELQLALEQEKEVVRMKNRFVSMVSHEFRTPLSTINFAAGFLKKNMSRLAPPEIEKKIENIENQVHTMTSMLDDVLTIGKTNAVEAKPNLTRLNIFDLITTISSEISNSPTSKHTIEINHSPTLDPQVKTDEKLTRSILTNLLMNAIKFSPNQNRIIVDLQDKKNEIEINVTDFGIGIESIETEKIFEPFHRADNATSISGTGLGLSIVKKACDILQGSIRVTSTPGKGSTFTVRLPRNNEHK